MVLEGLEVLESVGEEEGRHLGVVGSKMRKWVVRWWGFKLSGYWR